MELDRIYNEDCLEGMKRIPDGSVDLAVLDPPYNIGVKTQKGGNKIPNEWDRIEHYQVWMVSVLQEVARCLKDTGILYIWHNDMAQIVELVHNIHRETPFILRSFCIWDKGDSYRARSWKVRHGDGATALRQWFNICEYCLHFFKNGGSGFQTGLERIYSNPECFKPLKEWYRSEMERLGLTKADIRQAYCRATGKSDAMLRHYFCDSQFTIPTQQVWESVYRPLGFGKEYERLRQEYERLRHTHNMDLRHCNVWHRKAVPSNRRMHTCEKPIDIIERIIKVSSHEDETVLDCFLGSGTTAIACINTGRHFIGFEKEKKYFDIAERRIEETMAQGRLFTA